MLAEKRVMHAVAPIEEDRHYSLPEVAKLLGTSRWTVHRRVETGVIPASKAGRAYIVKGSDLHALIIQHN